ncbi:hypothetical protein [Kosakonia cowanii]|uniref:hypothetical protein n=1 Tax=Kosakonia cowanii TaxID=208223 RepID=UPI00345BC898
MNNKLSKHFKMFWLCIQPLISLGLIFYAAISLLLSSGSVFTYVCTGEIISSCALEWSSIIVPVSSFFSGVVLFLMWFFNDYQKYRNRDEAIKTSVKPEDFVK